MLVSKKDKKEGHRKKDGHHRSSRHDSEHRSSGHGTDVQYFDDSRTSYTPSTSKAPRLKNVKITMENVIATVSHMEGQTLDKASVVKCLGDFYYFIMKEDVNKLPRLPYTPGDCNTHSIWPEGSKIESGAPNPSTVQRDDSVISSGNSPERRSSAEQHAQWFPPARTVKVYLLYPRVPS